MNAVTAATAQPQGAPSIAVRFCGLELSSPVVLLSGCVGFGEEYTRVEGFSNRDAGAIVLKGTTGEPRLGNPAPRVYETPAGMLNAIGLQNPGVDYVVRRILPTLDFTETRFIANVCGSTIEEYVEVTRRFDDSPIDAIEINISCPNIKQGGVQFGFAGLDALVGGDPYLQVCFGDAMREIEVGIVTGGKDPFGGKSVRGE